MNDDVKKVVNEIKIELKKEADAIKEEAVNELKSQKTAIKAEATAWYNKLGLWGKVAVLGAVLVGYLAFDKFVAPVLSPVTNVNVTVPQQSPLVANAVRPTEADRAAAERLDATKLLAKVLRSQTVRVLQEDGLRSAGIDGKPLSRDAAIALASNLEDEHLVAVAQVSGVVPEGRILDTITAVLKWIIANKEAVKKIVELIIMLLAAFI